ncbi:MAG: ABC transporter ATP-binding protein [Microthrixaceae bacterium]|nr:ABC transporter ATP-binding protein [Microthrixaceae bacterium]
MSPASAPPASAPPASVPAASIHDGSKVYTTGDGPLAALDNVTLAFESGRFTAVMGPSGSGKSTLMQCMAGLDSLTAGRTFIGGVETTHMSPTELTLVRREQLGFIFQSFNLVPALTAEENILMPLKLAKRPVDREYFDYLVGVVGLSDRLRHKPAQLSGGQQQRVAVARALMTRPTIVFGDEPTGNLDSRSSAEVLQFMRTTVDQAAQTVVIVTHDPVAASYTDRVVFMADGRIVDSIESPTTESVIDHMLQFGS